jgi:sulfide:quinone oxidoreductase
MVHIVVVGGNFAGLTSALQLKRALGNICKVTIISKSPFFVFVPSLIWIPFGKRELEDITLPLEPITKKAQVEFVCAEVTQVLPLEKSVKCNGSEFKYDYLIIATGPEWIFNQVDGMVWD